MTNDPNAPYVAWWQSVYARQRELMNVYTTAQLRKIANGCHIYKPTRNPHTAKEFYAMHIAIEQLQASRPS